MSKIQYKIMRYLGRTFVVVDLGDVKIKVVLIGETLIIRDMELIHNVSPSKIEKCFAKFRGWMSVSENHNELITVILENGRDRPQVNPRYASLNFASAWSTING